MSQEPELEEGETCHYKDDASIDPDIALSYIGDKVQSILGHLQKDFEGGVSAENLGAKFGGYGSFLPMYQRSPSIWSQPQRVENPHLPKSPDVHPEGPSPNSVTVPDDPSTQKDVSSSSPDIRAPETSKTSLDDVPNRQKEMFSSNNIVETFPGKVERPSNKSGYPPDHRTLKVRIKVGPERVAQYNAEIYNLGLTSPSSSEGNSNDESDGLMLELHESETRNESPTNILKIMTSFPVSGGLLLSPLCEGLLNLLQEPEHAVERECETVPKSSAISVKLLNNNVFGGKKTKFVDKSGNLEKSEDEFRVDLNDSKPQTLDGRNLECSTQPFNDLTCRPLPDIVREMEKDVQVKKRKGNKDRVKGNVVSGDSVKDASLEHTSDQSFGKYEQSVSRCSSVEKIADSRARINKKDVSVDHGQGSRSIGRGNCASLKAYSDNSEGEGVKRSMGASRLKAGLNSTSSEHNGFGIPHTVKGLSSEGEEKSKGNQSRAKLGGSRDGDSAPEKKPSGKKDVGRLHLSQKDVVHTTLKHMENLKHLLERPSSDMPKNINLETVKIKSANNDKLKERFSNKKYFDNVSSEAHRAEPPAASVHFKQGTVNGLEQTVAAPVVIQEDWVGCDRCQKWRLLPYGTKSEQLPDKWVCTMLDWLPGMNRCDISEDETTKAVHASYLVPVPDNQYHSQVYASGTLPGASSASVGLFNQNHQNFASDQMMKKKLKGNQNAASMSAPSRISSKKQLKQLDMKNGSSKEVKLSLAGVNAANKSNLQHREKPSLLLAKSNKRKGEHVIEDDANLRKKVKKESAEHVHRTVKKIKSKDALSVDNFQTSGGTLNMIGNNLASGLPNKAAMNDGNKKSALRDADSNEEGNFQIRVKKHKDQTRDLPDNKLLGIRRCSGGEVATKKIKLKDYEYSQHQVETWENGSNLQDRKISIKVDNKDGDFHRDKKVRMSSDDISRSKSAEARVQSSRVKEYPVNRAIEKEQQLKKPKAKLQLTIEDIDKLRKDLGCEPLPMAATSSSSKVSDSRKNKNKTSYMKVKGSPDESVSSSPVRMTYLNHVSPMMMETVGKVDSRFNDISEIGSVKKSRGVNESSELGRSRKGTSGLTNDDSEILYAKNKLKEGADVDGNNCAPKHEVSSNTRHPFSDECSLNSGKNGKSVYQRDLGKSGDSRRENQSAQRDHDKNDVKSSYPCSTNVTLQALNQDVLRSSEQFPNQMEPWSGKLRIDLRQGDKQGALRPGKHASGSSGVLERRLRDSRPLDPSVNGVTSKALKDNAIDCLRNRTDDFNDNEAHQSVAVGSSLGNKNVSGVNASTNLKEAEDALKEAEELKTHADRMKNAGFSSESNDVYFQAALKFLHCASLLETCNGPSSKHFEMSPMQMYGTAAELFKTCAYECEKSHELAAAALAYKCVEVAYLRVVYCKSSTTCRVWQDLQSSLQLVPQGESPSSSASDVDNLNNLATADKATLSKGSGPLAGNHVIVPRNRPNFVRLLDFTKDVNFAMEATKKSQDTFAVAHSELEKSRNKEAIASVKKVIDFSFQNVEEFVQLSRFAFDSINHEGLNGSKG